MGSIFTAGFGILLLLLLTNWILRSLNKMIKDKEMKEILDEMKKEDEGEDESDVGSGNNDDLSSWRSGILNIMIWGSRSGTKLEMLQKVKLM